MEVNSDTNFHTSQVGLLDYLNIFNAEYFKLSRVRDIINFTT